MITMAETSGERLQNRGASLVDSPGGPFVRDESGIVGGDPSGGLDCRWLEQLLQVGMLATDTKHSDVEHGALSEMSTTHPGEVGASPLYPSEKLWGNRGWRQVSGAEPYSTMPNAKTPHESPRLESQVFTSNVVGKKKGEKSASEMQSNPEGKPKVIPKPAADIQGILQQCAFADSPVIQLLVAPRGSFTSVSVCYPTEPEAIEQRINTITRCCGSEAPDNAPGVSPKQQINTNETAARVEAIAKKAISRGFELQHGRDAKITDTVEAGPPIKGFSSSRVDALPTSQQFENGMDTKDPGAFTALLSQTSSPGSIQQPSHSVLAASKRSLVRSQDDYRRVLDPRTIGSSEVTTAVQNASHGGTPGKAPDEEVRDFRERGAQSSSEIPAQSNGALDLPLKHSGQQWGHGRPHFAEAGFQDPSLGWISVRATRDPAGLHALVVPPSPEAERTLSAHLSGLNAYLANNQIGVSAVGLSSCEDPAYNSNLGGDTQQRNAREEDREREEKHRPGRVERIDSTGASPRVRSTDSSTRHEFPWVRSGASGSGNNHISLVA